MSELLHCYEPFAASEGISKLALPWWRERPACDFCGNPNDHKRDACATMQFQNTLSESATAEDKEVVLRIIFKEREKILGRIALLERVLKLALPWWRERPACDFWDDPKDRKRDARATMQFQNTLLLDNPTASQASLDIFNFGCRPKAVSLRNVGTGYELEATPSEIRVPAMECRTIPITIRSVRLNTSC